jgi:hypothetical protein
MFGFRAIVEGPLITITTTTNITINTMLFISRLGPV